MFSPSTRDCAGAAPYNSFYPMYHGHHAVSSPAGGYSEAAAAHLTLPYTGGGPLQYPADTGYWDNYRSVIGGYNEWHGQGFGGPPTLAAQPGTPSPQQCAAGPGAPAGRNDSPDSGIVTGAADLPLATAGPMTAATAPAGPDLTPAGGGAYQRLHHHHHQQQQQQPQQPAQQQAQQQPQPARDSWEWLDRNSYPTTARPPPGKTRTKDKYRVVYSDAQRLELEKEFRYNNYITIKRKLELSRILGLTDRQVKIWFQNRRAKERKQKRRMEETAKRQLIDMQGGSGGGGGTATAADLQLGALSHTHLQGVHGLVPLPRQAPTSGGGAEAGRFPRYGMPGHSLHPEMAAPQQPTQQHQHQQQHQQQHQLVAKSEPRDGEPPAF